MVKIYVDEVPPHRTVAVYLRDRTDWAERIREIKPSRVYPSVMVFDLEDMDMDELASDVHEAMTIYGKHHWRTSDGDNLNYGGFSLVYNPNHIEDPDPHGSTWGTRRNARDQFFYDSTKTHQVLKNSYFDGYSFNRPTLASQHGSIGKLMSRSKLTRIRSRVAMIDAKYHRDPHATRVGWHRDEELPENIRLNIPLTTTKNFVFEIENKTPVHLGVGHAYSWDTNTPHRVYSLQQEESTRTHMVLGWSPWWDYIESENAWVQNEFYGKKHPMDMLVDGDVISGLRFRPDLTLLD